MELRTKLGALLGAGGILLLAATTVVAAPPTYTINVTKEATAAPPSGGNVTFSISVDNTGTGFFQTVNVDDGMAGCTPVLTSGDDGDDDLEDNETWVFTCTVPDVEPGDVNTATVNACHNVSACNQAAHDAQDSDDVTVQEGPEITAAPTTAPTAEPTAAPTAEPTAAPTAEPTNGPGSPEPTNGPEPTQDEEGGESTQAPTDTQILGVTIGGDNTWLLVIALGLLLSSVVLLTPAKPVRQR